jgi:hypothetical protein
MGCYSLGDSSALRGSIEQVNLIQKRIFRSEGLNTNTHTLYRSLSLYPYIYKHETKQSPVVQLVSASESF